MTATTAPQVKNQKSVPIGLTKSATVNLITDFIPSKFQEGKANTEKEKEDFVNTFICHLIFYAVFCISIVLHVVIDLGLGAFLKNKLNELFGPRKENVLINRPVLA